MHNVGGARFNGQNADGSDEMPLSCELLGNPPHRCHRRGGGHQRILAQVHRLSNVIGTGNAGTTANVTVTDGSLNVTLALLNQYANQFAVSSGAYSLTADNNVSNHGTLFQLVAHA